MIVSIPTLFSIQANGHLVTPETEKVGPFVLKPGEVNALTVSGLGIGDFVAPRLWYTYPKTGRKQTLGSAGAWSNLYGVAEQTLNIAPKWIADPDLKLVVFREKHQAYSLTIPVVLLAQSEVDFRWIDPDDLWMIRLKRGQNLIKVGLNPGDKVLARLEEFNILGHRLYTQVLRNSEGGEIIQPGEMAKVKVSNGPLVRSARMLWWIYRRNEEMPELFEMEVLLDGNS